MRGTRTTRTGKAASRARRPYVPPPPRFERQESDFVPLPHHLLSLRDRLRAVGHDLVRYSMDAATKEGAKYRHPPDEYEYAVHKIYCVDPEGQVIIERHSQQVSPQRLEQRVAHIEETEAPLGWSMLKGWFGSPATIAVTMLSPLYALAMLGLGGLSDRDTRKRIEKARAEVHRLKPTPKFRVKPQPFF